jgi:glycosyltransferase involved in cell wall biosynthesis
MGPGYQRNFAIKSVNTRYIAFVDGDDGISTSSQLHALQNVDFAHLNPDIVIYTNCNSFLRHVLNRLPPGLLSFLGSLQFINKVTFANKLFKVEWLRINNIRYSNRLLYEDILFHYLLLINSPRTIFLQRCFYELNARHDSRSRARRSFRDLVAKYINVFTELHKVTPIQLGPFLLLLIYILRLSSSLVLHVVGRLSF